ncbi:hypothetical protein, partial [Thauera terpenica]|uniref:hypothetical protein n=1 Tax=Thauera terpenica TaxID=76113 RepID=UPI0004CE130C
GKRLETRMNTGAISQKTAFLEANCRTRGGTAFAERLDDDVLSRLQALPPRSVRLVLQRALGSAARDDRGVVQVQDIRPLVEISRRGIGFVSEGWN